MTQCSIHHDKQTTIICNRCNRPYCESDLEEFETKKMKEGVMQITTINACSSCIAEILQNRVKQSKRTVIIMVIAMVLIFFATAYLLKLT